MTWQKRNGSFNVRLQLYELIRDLVPKKIYPKFLIGSGAFVQFYTCLNKAISHIESLHKRNKKIRQVY
jgi:hypothetical protein